MNKSSEHSREQWNILRRNYAERLPGKVKQIDEIWSKLQERWDETAVPLLHRKIHGLIGSGATFGYNAVSHAARKMENVLTSMIENVAPAEVLKREMASLLAELKDRAERPGFQEERPLPVSVPEEASGLPQRAERIVFLVEDDADLGGYLATQIGHFGYTVRHFTELTRLKETIQEIRPDVIIMDVIFPEGDLAGPEMIGEIQQQLGIWLPVVFTSARGDLMARLQAVRAGGDAYLTKPVDIGELVDKLDLLTSHERPAPYRVLIIDDDLMLAQYHALALQQAGMATECVTDPLEIMKPLAEFRPDLILMDIYMPGCNGLELAAVIRQQEAYVGIPIVFLSTETNLDRQLEAMQIGGDDFLTKPIHPDHLVSAVTTRIQRARTLRALMVRDSLTGLLNHTRIKEQLETEVARAQRQNTPLSFAMIDLDHFKSLNDRYGHPAGDRIIKSVARLLQQRLRRSDFVGRYGGEEFAVLLPNTDGPTAAQLLDEIRADFAKIRQTANGVEFSVTLSAGIASYPDYRDAGSLSNAADQALYNAKHQGRNRVVFAKGPEVSLPP